MNTTTNRVPMSDWYDVSNVNSAGFKARPVIGGLFMKMLTDQPMWAKYATAGTNTYGTWAPLPQTVTVVPTSQTSPQSWKYTTTSPAGTWMNTGFDDSTWTTANGPFGTANTPGITPNTTWNTGDIWMRRTFTMPGGSYSNLQFLLYHDEDIQVYLNGVLAYSATGYITSYQTADISPAARALLTSGATITMAVHCHQTTGGQGVDVGLAYVTQYAPIAPTSQATPQTWRYRTTTPVGNWTNSGFNDSSWTTASGAFGTANTPGIFPNTTWSTGDIWLRRTLVMPAGTYSGLKFMLYHDESIEVYLNGVLAYSATGYVTKYQIAGINSAALAVLTSGATITLAVHCHQTTGGQGVDVGIVNDVQLAPAAIVPQASASTQQQTSTVPARGLPNSAFNDPRINHAALAVLAQERRLEWLSTSSKSLPLFLTR
jgi:hypothetical protein